MKKTLLKLCSILLCFSPSLIYAQWGWIAKNGTKTYSDKAPTPDASVRSIFMRPKDNQMQIIAAPIVAASAATNPTATSNVQNKNPSTNDSAAEERKKSLEEQFAKTKTANCEMAQRSLAMLNSGVRIRTLNDKGESIIMDDAQKNIERQRIEEAMRSNCS